MNVVKELCKRKGIRQKELAEMLGIAQPSVSAWFNNKADPSGANIDKLAEIFNVNRSVILGYDPIAIDEKPLDVPEHLMETYELMMQLTDEEFAEIKQLLNEKLQERRKRPKDAEA